MMNEIVTFGHPSLKSKSVNITEFDETLKKLSERMLKIMYEAPGVGPVSYTHLTLPTTG